MTTDKEGTPGVFKALFFQYYPTFFAFAHSLVDDKISAQQLTVEALSILWIKRMDLTGDINNRAFLYSTIRNNALNYLKHLQREPDAGPYMPDKTMDTMLPEEIRQEIKDYVAREI
ncbi:sigma factor [Flavitalea sp. BT771]|uniref:sigma factor n=1 Tax=Flavitalea sp. BT771 TaxID=3063329 RepID=UPI0026E15F5B|nr:sigma factor [Flavitalea sp. BT771]MDO6431373.1 sigma factor [Flavitalea sp. BT771]MDV6220281.1 sigma factor [Flavitalea sp. BT771]